MSQVVSCPDCGTPNRVDADLCVQCWRGMNEELAARIPTPAFAAARAAPPPPAPVRARPEPAPRMTIEPVAPREADPGAVPYFAAGGPSVAPTFPLPSTPAPAATTKTAIPWGTVAMLAVVMAVLAGGYHFFVGRSSGTFSAKDGSFSMALPAGEWERMEDMEMSTDEGAVDLMLQNEGDKSFIMAMHFKLPDAVTPEMLKMAMTQAQSYMPKLPGVAMGPVQESNLVTGEGVTAYEMTARGGNPSQGAGKMRMVAVVGESADTLAMVMFACSEPQCAATEPGFDQMARSFEFSG